MLLWKSDGATPEHVPDITRVFHVATFVLWRRSTGDQCRLGGRATNLGGLKAPDFYPAEFAPQSYRRRPVISSCGPDRKKISVSRIVTSV